MRCVCVAHKKRENFVPGAASLIYFSECAYLCYFKMEKNKPKTYPSDRLTSVTDS